MRPGNLTIGQKFGELTIAGRSSRWHPPDTVYYICLCSCGNRLEVEEGEIKSGNTTSCGCKMQSFKNSRLNIAYSIDQTAPKVEYTPEEQIEILKAEIAQLKQSNQDLSKDIVMANRSLEKAEKNTRTLETKIEQSSKEIESLKATLSTSIPENRQYWNEIKTVRALRNETALENAALNIEINKLEQKIQSLETQIEELENATPKHTPAQLITNIGEKTFIAGSNEWVEFTYTTIANDDKGTVVTVSSDFSSKYENYIAALEFNVEGNWYNLKGMSFGGGEGFALADETSLFRVKFTEDAAGEYIFDMTLKSGETIICTLNQQFVVA